MKFTQSHSKSYPHHFYREAVTSFVHRFPRECAAAFVLILFASITALVPPLVLGRFVDALGTGEAVLVLGFGYFAASALAGLFESGQDACIVAVGQRLMHALRSRMAAKLPTLPAAYFSRHASGETAALFLKDVDAIDVLFTDGILSLFANSLRIVAILAAVAWTSRGLFFLLCITLPVLFLFTRFVQRRVLATQSANRSAVARIVAVIPETLASFRMIRGLGVEPWMERRYGRMLDVGYVAQDRTNFYDSVYSPVIKTTGVRARHIRAAFGARHGDPDHPGRSRRARPHPRVPRGGRTECSARRGATRKLWSGCSVESRRECWWHRG